MQNPALATPPSPEIERALREGFARQNANDLSGAEAIYRAVLSHLPEEHRALTLLASLHESAGDTTEAIEAYRQALHAAPNAPGARYQLANLLFREGDAQATLDLIRPFTQAFPNAPNGWALRARAAERAEERQEAADCFQQSLNLGDEMAAGSLGTILLALGDRVGALAAFERALKTMPDNSTLHGALGNAYSGLGNAGAAIQCYRRALELDPGLYEAHGSLGVALQGFGQYDEAANAYIKALEWSPDRWEVLNNLAGCRLDQGRPRLSRATYRELIKRNPNYQPARRNLCMATAYDDGKSAADLAAVCAEAVQDLVIAPRFAMSNTDGRPLKIGFVSADLRGHSVSAFVEPLFANADPSEIELLVYANIAKPDAVTERLKSHVSLWRDTNDWDDHETSVAVAADGVDILFDLAGHTGDARLDLFALRPAPVQASWLGWPATTGLAAIDFKLSDALLTPADTTEPFTETPLNLAGPALCFQPPSFAPEVAPLPALANGHITFGSFNRIAKASPRTLALWAEVLTAMPSAQLYLKDNAFRCPVATAHFSDRLTAAGITPDRVTLNPSTTAKDEHLTHYGQVDIALDSVPYNGVTTTCEALWMGVPTVSLVGESSLSRYGLSVLTHAGFESCVATDGKGYVERALKLASNPTELSAIRQGMREHLKTTALFDGPAFAHNFAAGCREMVEIITNQ